MLATVTSSPTWLPEESASGAVFRSPCETAPLDWMRLSDYLAEQGHALDLLRPPRQFAGGFGNLNFLVTVDDQHCVLRRPPFGFVPPGANDMAREHRVLSRLGDAYPLAPRSLHYCEDPSVLGAHFLIMEYRQGLVIGHQLPDGLGGPTAGSSLSLMMVSVLASLHEVNPESAGLADLGKPQGFLARATQGWTRRAEAVTEGRVRALVTDISRWLAGRVPPEMPATLLHCDFKLDNIVLDPLTLKPCAVLDWDMCTRGDPLFDLATLLSYWVEPSDPDAMHQLRQMPTALEGFYSRTEVMSAYASITGRDISNFLFYRVLALFKLGVVFLQLHARFLSGATTDPRYAGFDRLGRGILEFTHAAMSGKSI